MNANTSHLPFDKNSALNSLISFPEEKEQHFPEFREKRASLRGIPRLISKICCRRSPRNLRNFLAEWFEYWKFTNFHIFQIFFQLNCCPNSLRFKSSIVVGWMENVHEPCVKIVLFFSLAAKTGPALGSSHSSTE